MLRPSKKSGGKSRRDGLVSLKSSHMMRRSGCTHGNFIVLAACCFSASTMALHSVCFLPQMFVSTSH